MAGGYIKIYRSLEKWDWADNPIMVYFWCRILLMANWEDKKWRGITIPRGSFKTSLAELSEALNLSVKTIRTCIERLRETGEVTTQATNKYSIVTICKYDTYQSNEDAEGQASGQAEGQTRGTQHGKQGASTLYTGTILDTAIEERKEIKNKKKSSKDDKEKTSLLFPFSSDKFMSTWSILIQQPKWKKKSLHALQMNLDDLAEYQEAFAVKLMEDSIKNNWQGVVFQNTKEKYQAWLKDHPIEEHPQETIQEGKPWKHPHYLYSYAEFMANDPDEFSQLNPVMQEDLKAGKKMLCFEGIWEWPEDHPNYEIIKED